MTELKDTLPGVSVDKSKAKEYFPIRETTFEKNSDLNINFFTNEDFVKKIGYIDYSETEKINKQKK